MTTDRTYPLSAFSPAPLASTGSGSSGADVQLSRNLPRLNLDKDLPEEVSQRTKMLIVQGQDVDDPERYPSRSEVVMAVACALVRAGCSDDLIGSVLLDQDFGISAHIYDQPRPQNYAARQIKQARKKVAKKEQADAESQASAQDAEPPQNSTATKTVIKMAGGELTRVVDQAQDALLSNGVPIYQRGGELLRTALVDQVVVEEPAIRRPTGSMILVPVNKHWLTEQMARAAVWKKYSVKVKGWVAADPNIEYAIYLLKRQGEWEFPVLRGLVSAPTLARDGRIIQKPGYDVDSGLLLNFEVGSFPIIPENPTEDEAQAALEKLNHLLRGFPFVTVADRSVALSALLTALIRLSLRTAPLHSLDAPQAGTGKSLLAEMAGLLATGRKPAAMSQGKTPDEDEKRLSAVSRAGDSVILIDNCERPLGGDFLCSMLTQETVQARILGRSEMMTLPSAALILATGNNLVLEGDISRRVVNCRLDAKEERPDQRPFDFDCQAELLADRANFVVAGLTALRAFVVAGRPAKLTPMGSFSDWEWVRGTLVWLGKGDPADTRDAIVSSDPDKEVLMELMEAWKLACGDEQYSLAEIDKAGSPAGLEWPAAKARMEGDMYRLWKALIEASNRPTWNAKSVGKRLRKYKGRIVEGRFFESAQVGHHQKWWLAKAQRNVAP